MEPRHSDSTIPQYPNPVVVLVAPSPEQTDVYRRLVRELHIVPTVVVADRQSVATVTAQWRPFAIVLDEDVFASDAEGFRALARDVTAELTTVGGSSSNRVELERALFEQLKAGLERWEARELPGR